MKKDELRKVQVRLNEYKSEWSEGYFHGWTIWGSYNEGLNPVGIIELTDGSVDTVKPYLIKFV